MVVEILKYKHYLILLVALLLANYSIVPLGEWQEEQKLNLQLLTKQYEKTQILINNKSELSEQLTSTQLKLLSINQVIYKGATEEKFKLTVQSKIEKLLDAGDCEIDRIGFKGNTVVSSTIDRWLMEVRFKGNVLCLTNATRTIEALSPYLRIVSYNFNHKGLEQDVAGKFNAQMQVNAWYQKAQK